MLFRKRFVSYLSLFKFYKNRSILKTVLKCHLRFQYILIFLKQLKKEKAKKL